MTRRSALRRPARGPVPRGGRRGALARWLLVAGVAAGLPARADPPDAAPPPDAQGAAPCLERAVSAVQGRYEGVRDVSARFVQTTRPVSMGASPSEPETSEGRVVLAKPGRMRWIYEKPRKSLVVSDGETLWLYDPEFREAQRLPMAEGFLSGAAAQFLLGAGDLRRDFEVSAVSCEPGTAVLELVPREPATYEKIFLTVDPATGDVRSSRVVDLLGNVSEVAFHEVVHDRDPAPGTFTFDPPEGVKVIEIER